MRGSVERSALSVKERPIPFTAENGSKVHKGTKTETRRLLKQPFKVYVPEAVQSELPPQVLGGRPGVLRVGEYRADMNPHGAVFAIVAGQRFGLKPGEFEFISKYGRVGDRLWVREPWRVETFPADDGWEYGFPDGGKIEEPDTAADHPGFVEWQERVWIQCTEDCEKAKLPLNSDDHYYWEPGKSPCRWRPSIFLPRWVSRTLLEITAVRVERLQDINQESVIREGTDPSFLGAMSAVIKENARAVPTIADFERLWDSINKKKNPWSSNPWVEVITFRKLDACATAEVTRGR